MYQPGWRAAAPALPNPEPTLHKRRPRVVERGMTLPPLSKGAVLASRYEIREVLGVGGMARVYRACDRHAGREVAIKVLPASASEDLHRRFRREVRNAARLGHRACVGISDHGETEDGSMFFAMELLPGPSLREELERGPLSPAQATQVAADILAGLEHAHDAGLLHRDVKPENVVFRGAGADRRAVLIDFGLSELGGDARLTDVGSCVGSPSYLAPERLLGTGYDARADLYAVGVLIYEMVTGEKPFAGQNAVDTARLHLEYEPPALAAVAPDVPAALSAACARALDKDPAGRFESAAEMAAAMGRPLEAPQAAQGDPGLARSRPSLWSRALRWLGALWPRGQGEPPGAPSGSVAMAGSGTISL